MKLSTVVLGLTVAAWVVARGVFNYVDRKGDITLQATRGIADTAKNGKVSFVLTGAVQAGSKSQGLKVSAARATGTLQNDPQRAGSKRLSSLNASGGVTINRQRNAGGVSQTTTLTSASATYSLVAAQSAEIQAKGGVTINDRTGARGIVLSGESGTAILGLGGTTSATSLSRATLTSNVKVKVTQPAAAGKPASIYNASGDRLVYTTRAGGATVVLSGNLKVDALDPESGGTITGAETATITLDEKGEITNVSLSSDGTATVRTEFRKQKKGRV